MAVDIKIESNQDHQGSARIKNLPAPTDPSDAARLQDITGGAGPSIKETITQAGHGFAAGNSLKFAGGVWAKAQANSAANAEFLGMVESVSGDDFTVVYGGRITGLSGLTANTLYFLDAATAGDITDTPPSGSNVRRTVLFATSTTSGIVIQHPGFLGEATGAAEDQLTRVLSASVFS